MSKVFRLFKYLACSLSHGNEKACLGISIIFILPKRIGPCCSLHISPRHMIMREHACVHTLFMFMQVYAAVDQAVLQAPQQPEVHNLKGLLCELRGEYSSAILAFQTSRAALESNVVLLSPHSVNVKRCAITINLARCLCKVGTIKFTFHSYALGTEEN